MYVRSRLRAQARVEDKLRASEAKFSGILAIAADAIITVDHHQRIVHFNRGAEEIFGHSTADALGRHLNILIPPRFRETHGAHMERFAQSAATARRMGERREIFGLRADGGEFPAEASISKLVTEDGVLFTVVLRDITLQKRAEAEERFLADSSGELSRTLAIEPTLHAIADLPVPRLADACLVDLVEPSGGYRRVGSSRPRSDIAPIIARLSSNPLHVDSPSPIVDVIRRSRAELISDMEDDWSEANADRENVQYWRALAPRSLLIVPLQSAGTTLGALTLIRTTDRPFDAEQRQLGEKFAAAAATALQNATLYDAAKQANRARDEVLGVVSHDLRNPISAIAMCARVLVEDSPASESNRAELLGIIRESAATADRMIEDLLDVANIERGKLALEVRANEPSQLALRAVHMFELEAREHGITLEAKLPTNLPLVAADDGRIVQVIGNLLRNAIKFTPRGGRIVIAVQPRDGMIEFSASDTGSGIASENRSRVFERYWQQSSGARSRGSGLGLSIARGIVEAHGGRIWVESEPGKGSVFTFSIPQVAS